MKKILKQKLINIIFYTYDKYYDKKLNIKTYTFLNITSRVWGCYDYEPTPYIILRKLFKKYPFSDSDVMVDAGCGLGRILIFAKYFGCKNIFGFDINSALVEKCSNNIINFENKYSALSGKINVENCISSDFVIPDGFIKYFMFNPFHIKFFIKFTNNILKKNFDCIIFLYCPSEEYKNYLSLNQNFSLIDIIYFDKKNDLHAIYVYKHTKTN